MIFPVRRPALVLALVALALVAGAGEAAAQGCAMCGTVGQGKDDPLVRGMFASILFMVSMPFAVVGAVAAWLWASLRRGRADGVDHGAVASPSLGGAPRPEESLT